MLPVHAAVTIVTFSKSVFPPITVGTHLTDEHHSPEAPNPRGAQR
jgi:hypothetical protein